MRMFRSIGVLTAAALLPAASALAEPVRSSPDAAPSPQTPLIVSVTPPAGVEASAYKITLTPRAKGLPLVAIDGPEGPDVAFELDSSLTPSGFRPWPGAPSPAVIDVKCARLSGGRERLDALPDGDWRITEPSISCASSPTLNFKITPLELQVDALWWRGRSTQIDTSQGSHNGYEIVDSLAKTIKTGFAVTGINQNSFWPCTYEVSVTVKPAVAKKLGLKSATLGTGSADCDEFTHQTHRFVQLTKAAKKALKKVKQVTVYANVDGSGPDGSTSISHGWLAILK